MNRLIESSKGWSFGIVLLWLAAMLPTTSANDVVVVVLDDSGSMKESMRTGQGKMSRIEAARQALRSVVDSLPENTQLGILLLNGAKANDHWVLALGKIDKQAAKGKIERIEAKGGTPLGRAMQKGMNELLQVRAKQRYGNYRLIVVTDGEATDADVLASYFPDMISRGISIDVIGVDMREAHSLSQRAHSYRKASDPESFQRALQEVFAETASSDGGEDFAMIDPLTEELAREALAALGGSNNNEISNLPLPVSDGIPSQQPHFGTPTAPSSGIGSGLCCFGVLMIIILLGGLTAGKRKRRR